MVTRVGSLGREFWKEGGNDEKGKEDGEKGKGKWGGEKRRKVKR